MQTGSVFWEQSSTTLLRKSGGSRSSSVKP